MKRKLAKVKFVKTLSFGTARAMMLEAGSAIKLYYTGSMVEVTNQQGTFLVSATMVETAEVDVSEKK